MRLAISKLRHRINQLKEEKDVLILAHYYVAGDVQDIADFVGDSYHLSKMAQSCQEQIILFCGVQFMAESAKLLNPEKRVVLASAEAKCPMAYMAEVAEIEAMRQEHQDLAVVCYVNSTARIKALSDVCVTSTNAVQIVKGLKQKNIYFIPDQNLGKYIEYQVPDKKFFFCDGFCHVHTSIKQEQLEEAKATFPQAQVLAHPECTFDILRIADYIGSTTGIINYATKSTSLEFIICTEIGVLHRLKRDNPHKSFYLVGEGQICSSMKVNTLEKVYTALQTLKPEINVAEDLGLKAKAALEAMHSLTEISRGNKSY